MIKLCDSALCIPTSTDSWEQTFVLSRLSAYGTNAVFAPFYTDGRGGVASVLDGYCILTGDFADMDEWAIFLSMHQDIHTVSATHSVANRLGAVLHKTPLYREVMQWKTLQTIATESVKTPTPREIYPVLSTVFKDTLQPFDGWYVDVSHRLRHEICHVAGVYDADTLVSTAMTVAESENAVVIGSVATLPNYRKRGYAAQCIYALIHNCKPKTIFIQPKNDAAKGLYEKLGFEICGKIGILEMRDCK